MANRCEGWMLKVFEQKKLDNSVLMRCALSGRKKDDGTYGKSMSISVILTADTDWVHADLTGKVVDVNGNFSISDYTNPKNNETYINYNIFADKVVEHVWEEKTNEKGKSSKKW